MATNKLENQKTIIEVLIKGHELATRLEALLQEGKSTTNHEPKSTTKELAEGVMGSFSRALAAVDSRVKIEGCQYYEKERENPCGKKKIQSAPREGYRRRSHPYSWKRTKAQTLDDGHSWQKYGQKKIYKAKFPRSYFRCTHKYDQGCQAMRQVQRSEEDPSMYVINYFGEHKCRDLTEAVDSLLQGDHCMIDFTRKTSSHFSTLKQEYYDEEVVSNKNVHVMTPGSSSSDYFDLPEIGTLERSADQLVSEFVGGVSDHSDVNSGLQSYTGSMAWEFMEDSVEFHDIFSYKHHEFLR